MPTMFGFIPLPVMYQIPFGCLKFILGISIAFLSEVIDLVLDLVYCYKLGMGEILDRRLHIEASIQMCMFVFAVIGKGSNFSFQSQTRKSNLRIKIYFSDKH